MTQTTQATDVSMTAWRLFLQTHAALLDVLEQELKDERDLPLTWFEVLLFASGDPSGIRMTELANSVLLSKSGLTRVIDRMEGAGLIQRAVCPSDRRGVFVRITPRGAEELDAARPVHLRGIRDHFLHYLEPHEVVALESSLAKIAAALPGRACPPPDRAAAS